VLDLGTHAVSSDDFHGARNRAHCIEKGAPVDICFQRLAQDEVICKEQLEPLDVARANGVHDVLLQDQQLPAIIK
jgi:hypothetical protein